MQVTDADFEREFRQIEASWGFEGITFTQEEKEQIRRCLMGEITHDEFGQWMRHQIQRGTGKENEGV